MMKNYHIVLIVGGENLAYIDQYANGEYWKCKECGKEFMWQLNKKI